MPFLPILGAQEVALSTTLTYAGLIAITSGVPGTFRSIDGSLIVGTVTETWTVADAVGTLDGDNDWDDYLGTHQWNVASGTASLQGVGGAIMQGGRLIIDLGADDYQVSITLVEWLDAGSGIMWVAPVARMQGDTSATFYAFDLLTINGTPSFVLYSFINGTQTQLGGMVPATGPLAPAPGMVITLRVRGTEVQGYVNGALVRSIDMVPPFVPILTGRFAGLQGGASTGNRVRVDSLVASQSSVYVGSIPITIGLAAQASVHGAVSPIPSSTGGQLMITQGTSFGRKVRMLNAAGQAVLGAALTISLAKGSGAFTAITPAVVEQGDGWYNITFTPAHNDTVGSHTAYVTAPGAVPRELFDQVTVSPNDEVVEGTVTVRQSHRLANAANAGKVVGAGTTNPKLRDLADTKDRVSAVVDVDGNRTSVTRDLT